MKLHARTNWQGPASRAAAAALTLLVVALCTSRVHAVTPESPEVVAVINRGLAALEKASDERLGGKALIGLCFWKAGRGIEHPQVIAAIKICQVQTPDTLPSIDTYSHALGAIFLCELDQQNLREVTQMFVTTLLKRQKPHGGFGYQMSQTGDTSQTQYAALAMWMAKQKGYDVPQEAVEKLCGWLLRTQDPTGSWGYQGNDPGAYVRVNQSYKERLSLLVAGLGSVYICADMLGITDIQKQREERTAPMALKEVGVEQPAEEKNRDGVSKVIDVAIVRRAMADGNQCFARNYRFDVPQWKWYYVYGMERYLSYKELTERKKEREPKWYNDGFAYLRNTQLENGFWPPDEAPSPISTCFALLFLMRSSGKAVSKANPDLGEGVLLGRMGLPTSTADIREKDGKVVETPLAGSIDELLTLIEKPDHPELSQLVDSAAALKLEGDVTKRTGQIARLRALVSAGSFEARLVAVKALGKVRDLDNVPVLVYAMTDPDVRIVREADKALRFLSRKFQGVGLPEDPSPEDRQAAVRAWKAWYLSVRPDGEFLD